MKEVKIYTIVSDQLSPPITGESFCTDMVRHSDYAELEDKYAALAADNDKAMESLKQADAVVKLAHEKFSALASENAALKKSEVEFNEYCRRECEDVGDTWEDDFTEQTYKLPEIIEGMEVSVDVSTCDFDAGHRYFGTVTEVSELDTAKNGYILLVQDAKPNFDVNGNSPVIPDGWISCSERMPDNDESKPIANFTGKCLGQGMFVATYDDDGFFDYWEGMEIIGVTHWMPLPEPPQK